MVQTLEGGIVRLEPPARRHEEGLFEAARDERILAWVPFPVGDGSYYPAASREQFRPWFEDALARSAAGTEVAFATVDAGTGEPIGSTRFLACVRSTGGWRSAGPGSRPRAGGQTPTSRQNS